MVACHAYGMSQRPDSEDLCNTGGKYTLLCEFEGWSSGSPMRVRVLEGGRRRRKGEKKGREGMAPREPLQVDIAERDGQSETKIMGKETQMRPVTLHS